jgi:hypothetical protein
MYPIRSQSIAMMLVAVSVVVASGCPRAYAHGGGGGGHGGSGGHGGGGAHSGGSGGYRSGYQSTYPNGYWGARTVSNLSGQGQPWFDPAAKVGFPEDMPLNRLHQFFVRNLPHLHPNAERQNAGAAH